MPFDILAGSSELREQIERGMPAREIARSWEDRHQRVRGVRERFLLILIGRNGATETRCNQPTQARKFAKKANYRYFSLCLCAASRCDPI